MVIGDDAPERLAELPERHGLEGVTFLHDPGGEVGARYGVMRTPEPASAHGGHTEPAVLVLRPDRTVAQASYAVSSMGRMPVDDALRTVRRIRTEERENAAG